jgi:hypothetical protein
MAKPSKSKVPVVDAPGESPRPAPKRWQKIGFGISALLMLLWVIFLAFMAKK